MEILYILVPISIIIISIAVWIFGWAIKSGQFDDLEGPAHRILFEDDEHMIPKQNPKKDQSAKGSQDSSSNL